MSQNTVPSQNVEDAGKKQMQLESVNVNHFTLEDRVRMIQAYEKYPVYTKISLMFNCKWTDVRKIVRKRDSIMKLHRNTLNTNYNEVRERKIYFLGRCMYVYIQRAQACRSIKLNEKVIRIKAMEFCQKIQIENFSPNRMWINQFKENFNLKSFRSRINFNLTSSSSSSSTSSSLDLNDIITYCLTQPSQAWVQPVQTVQIVQPVQQNNNRENGLQNPFVTPKRKINIYNLRYNNIYHKINLLEKCLFEYILRAQYNEQKTVDDETLKQLAFDLDYMLKIPIFRPNLIWVYGFKDRYHVNQVPGLPIGTNRIPAKSLDLKQIIDDISQSENKKHLVPRKRRRPIRIIRVTSTPTSSQIDEKYYYYYKNRRNTENTENAESNKNKEESNEVDEIQTTPSTSKNRKRPGHNLRVTIERNNRSVENVEEEEDVKPDLMELKENSILQTPPSKIKKLASTDMKNNQNAQQTQHEENPKTPKTPNKEPKQIQNCEEALTLVKALREFPILKKSYKCVSALLQLEAMLTVYQHFHYATED